MVYAARTRVRSIVATVVMLLGARPATGQRANELALPNGGVVEVIGLRRWTIGMIQDSLGRYSPKDSLQHHSCASVLREKLHFADAAATYYFEGATVRRVVVTVREPQDSARVRYRVLPFDTSGGQEEWTTVTTTIRKRRGFFDIVIPSTYLFNMQPRLASAGDSAEVNRIVAFLKARTSKSDRKAAIAAIAKSPNMYDREAAVLILANFLERDEAWHALLDALLLTDGREKAVASSVLRVASTRTPRVVDWRARSAEVRAILDGTSLFFVPDVISVLLKTGVGPRDAARFLRGGGEILLDYLGSNTPQLVQLSHDLLVRLRGEDLGADVEPWRQWIASL